MNDLLKWLESLSLATGIRDSLYLFPLIESFHVLGLATLFGMIAIFDLRLLGLASVQRPLPHVMTETLKWAWRAFALTATTGLLMFITNASGYFSNPFFRVKMVLLALALANIVVFELTAGPELRRQKIVNVASTRGRAAAVLSLVLWIAIIAAGRWIGFTKAKPEAPTDPGVNFDDLFAPPPGDTSK